MINDNWEQKVLEKAHSLLTAARKQRADRDTKYLQALRRAELELLHLIKNKAWE